MRTWKGPLLAMTLASGVFFAVNRQFLLAGLLIGAYVGFDRPPKT